MARLDRGIALGVGAALAIYYLVTACAEVQGADAGEFATLFAQGGVAHPTGYPLYVLYLRVLRWMPGASPALASARATALLAWPALALVYAALRAWTASRVSAIVALALFGLGRVACEQFTQPEAFALNVLLCAAFLSASGPASRLRGGARVVALGFIAGLGAAHHHTLATLAPVGLLAAVRAIRLEGARPRHVLWAVAAFALGLLAYVYPWWIARHARGEWVWGAPIDARKLLGLFLRADYWRTGATPRYPAEYVAAFGHGLTEVFCAVGLLAVGVGVVVLLRGAGARASRAGVAPSSRSQGVALVASFALAGPLLLATFPSYPTGARLAVAERFFLLPTLVALVPFSVGLDVLIRLVRRPWLVGAPLLGALVAVHVWWIYPRLAEDRRPTAARYVRNVLRALPPRAVVLGTGDLGCFGFLYAQQATRLREDVTYVDVGMMELPWYRARIAARVDMDAGDGFDVAVFLNDLERRGQPVFVGVPGPELPATTGVMGHAGLLQVLEPGASPPDGATLEASNLAWMRNFEWDDHPVRDPWSWAGLAERGYRATWESVASRYREEGRPEDAARALSRAGRGALGP